MVDVSHVWSVFVLPATTSAVTSGRRRALGVWLMGCSVMVGGAVVIGGITRLTESGLSMTQWHLIKGMRPPRSRTEWEEEFEKYKQFPEYKVLVWPSTPSSPSLPASPLLLLPHCPPTPLTLPVPLPLLLLLVHLPSTSPLILLHPRVHQELTLEGYKKIFFWEYFHRMWGRSTGLAVLVPAAFFWARGWLSPSLKKRAGIYSALVVIQVFSNTLTAGWLFHFAQQNTGKKWSLVKQNPGTQFHFV